MAQANQNGDNLSKLSLAFVSQTAAQSAKQQAHPAAPAGRVRRIKKNLGFKIDNSN